MHLLLLALLLPLAAADVRARNTVVTWAGTLNYTEDWGYTTVRSGAHSFWWLYAVDQPKADRPLFLWLQASTSLSPLITHCTLQGGPGSSGVSFGNFEETGPKDQYEKDRQSTWLQVGDLVFVDNPVGTGFSYVDSADKYTRTVADIGQDLLTWAVDFFGKHPEYRSRPFYIVCESYGGKMTAEFARVLYLAVKSGLIPLQKFKGIGLGDSWISPMDFVNSWGPYLYAQSYLDDQQLDTVNAQAAECQSLVDKGKWSAATDCWSETENVVGFLTGGVSWYNVLKSSDQDDWSMKHRETNRVEDVPKKKTPVEKLYDNHVRPFMLHALNDYMNTVIRKKLGIIPDNVKFGGQGFAVFDYQSGDFMRPNYDTVDTLLGYGLQVTVFNGQLDLICDTIGAEKWINRLKWTGLNNFKKADKKAFSTKNFDLAGFTKSYKNLQFIYILRAGHMVAHDTEESGLYVLQQLIKQSN